MHLSSEIAIPRQTHGFPTYQSPTLRVQYGLTLFTPTCISDDSLIKTSPSCSFASRPTLVPPIPSSSHYFPHTRENLYPGVRLTTCNVTTLDCTWMQKETSNPISCPPRPGVALVCTQQARQDMKEAFFPPSSRFAT